MRHRAARGPIAVWLTVVALLLQLAACSAPTAPQPSTPAAATLDDTPPQAADRQASLVSRTHVDGRMWDIVVRSPALRSEVPVRLLLPQRYADEPARRWPVLYLFHGCCDNYLSWTRFTDIEQLSDPWNLLVAMPDGGQVGFYSNWRTGPAWEAFHTRELPLLLAAQYRGSKLQAVGGVSMGGLGALGYAARHSGQYAAAVSISGIVHTLLSDEVSRNYLGPAAVLRS